MSWIPRAMLNRVSQLERTVIEEKPLMLLCFVIVDTKSNLPCFPIQQKPRGLTFFLLANGVIGGIDRAFGSVQRGGIENIHPHQRP